MYTYVKAVVRAVNPINIAFFWLVVAAILLLSPEVTLASEAAETLCEENADDLKRLAWWVVIVGGLTIPLGIGALILPVGGALLIMSEVLWAFC